MSRFLGLAEMRAARWADGALRDVRRELSNGPISPVVVAPVPELPARSRRGVDALLRIRRSTCLEAALVRQNWLAAQGDRRDVVIGVGAPADGFIAHAWLDGEEQAASSLHLSELTRLSP